MVETRLAKEGIGYAGTRLSPRLAHCPHYGFHWIPQDGTSRDKQTYRCGDCNRCRTPDGDRHYYSEAVKSQAASMYLEVGSISALGRVLQVRPETVYSWIKKAAQARTTLKLVRERPAAARPAGVVAMVISLSCGDNR